MLVRKYVAYLIQTSIKYGPEDPARGDSLNRRGQNQVTYNLVFGDMIIFHFQDILIQTDLSNFLLLVEEDHFNQETVEFIRYLSWVELEPVSTQLKLGISEITVDTELIYSEATLGYSLGPQFITVDN